MIKGITRNTVVIGTVLALTLGLSAFALAGCGSSDPKALYESKCGTCHSLTVVDSANYKGADQWKSVVDRMKAQTTTISDADATAITQYLADNHQ